jgi:hypothetical protein
MDAVGRFDHVLFFWSSTVVYHERTVPLSNLKVQDRAPDPTNVMRAMLCVPESEQGAELPGDGGALLPQRRGQQPAGRDCAGLDARGPAAQAAPPAQAAAQRQAARRHHGDLRAAPPDRRDHRHPHGTAATTEDV